MTTSDDFSWHDVREWENEGQGWRDTQRRFDRLPGRAQGVVRQAVWDLSRHSSGVCLHFQTDAPRIAARWTLLLQRLAMPHMPASGVSGLDLYAQDNAGSWRWLAATKPDTLPQVQATLVDDLDGAPRAYRLYLPLYNGVEALEIGVPRGASLVPLPARRQRPIVFYGTSITHGASASRPGMSHPAILGRRLNQPIVNLGFSGNGIMEPEVAALLAELDPSVYVVDCLPNMAAPAVTERTGPLVRTLRATHPETPIVLVEDRPYTDGWLRASRRERNRTNHGAFRREHAALLSAGVQGLHYVPGDNLFGDDGEAAVDGSHPTDVGFMRMADALEPVLRALL